jgi:hypothetical protein
MKDICKNCKKWMSRECEERKASGKNPAPNDWCRGFKERTQAIERGSYGEV